MNVNDVFPSSYLKAGDLQNREIQVTIDRVDMEQLGNDTKAILYFVGKQKGVVLNKTNAMNISTAYGPETDGWIGKPVVLFSVWTDFQGKSVQAIRIRPGNGAANPRQHPQTTPPPAPPVDDFAQEVPF